LRFSLLLGNLLFSNFPLATTTISSLTTISKSPSPPPPPISHFFSNNNYLYFDHNESEGDGEAGGLEGEAEASV
jgi:hypothetical protein